MKHLKKAASLLLAGVLSAALLAGCSSSPSDDGASSGDSSAASASQSKTGGPFLSMSTTDLDGKTVDSSVFAENTLTLVNVWNVGCTPCIQELPILDRLNKEYAGKGVAIKGLYYNFAPGLSDADRPEVEKILAGAGAEYQQLLLSQAMLDTKELGQIAAFPTTFFVDSEGNVVDTVMGSNDYDGWKAAIEAQLAKVQADA